MPRARVIDGFAFGAGFDRRLAFLCGFLLAAIHRVDRAVPCGVAGEVQHQAVILALGKARAATDHLDIEPDALGGAQQRAQISDRRNKTGREHIGVGDAA